AVDQPGNDHGLFGRAQQSHGGGDGHAQQHVGKLIITGGQCDADGGPVGPFGNGDFQPLFFKESLLYSNHKRRTIRQRNNTRAQTRDLRRVAGEHGADPTARSPAQQRSDTQALQGTLEKTAPGARADARDWTYYVSHSAVPVQVAYRLETGRTEER